jgi:polyisoprenyl-phosphate glycosyltransferase
MKPIAGDLLQTTDHLTLPLVSVVAPCFNEEKALPEFFRRTVAACHSAVGERYEIILVDDGSRDGTWPQISDFSEANCRVLGVRLFRNHGHQLAVTAGLAVSSGSRVMLIDADLQDPPELLTRMMAMMDEGADVVYGRRNSRKGETYFKLLTASLFYRLLNSMSGVPIPQNAGDFRLMRREVVDILNAMPERHRFVRGLVSWIGGKQVPLLYDRDARIAGTTKYPLKKMLRFAVDGITSFSTAPLRVAVWLGLSIAVLAFSVACYALIQWGRGAVIPGWASSFIAIALFSCVQLLVLGVIGEYLGRVFEEVKRRPLYIIGTLRKNGKDHALPGDFCQGGVKKRRTIEDAE